MEGGTNDVGGTKEEVMKEGGAGARVAGDGFDPPPSPRLTTGSS